MTARRGERFRVAISAAPPLLCDALRTLIDGEVEVTIVLDEISADEVFDLAIVTPGATQPRAELVVELDDEPDARGGGRLLGGSVATELPDLDAVVRLVGALSSGDLER